MVEAMLALVKDATERIDSRCLEPACGSGNFLIQIARRKVAAAALNYGKPDFAHRHDDLSMRSHDGTPIILAEWGDLDKAKFQPLDSAFAAGEDIPTAMAHDSGPGIIETD